MRVKVSSGFSGKIPTGNFQNMAPSFYAEIEYELMDQELEISLDAAQKKLHAICLKNFEIVAEMAKVEKLKADMKGFRFYQTDKGQYPSVTTIMSPDFKAWLSDAEMDVVRSEGNLQHAKAAHFIETGKWVDFKKLEGVGSDLLKCHEVFLEYWDFPAMLEKHPIREMKNGEVVVNDEHRYAGLPDFMGLYPLGGEKDADWVPTLFDIKRTPDRDKNFIQMAAYAKCLPEIKQMGIIPCKTGNSQNFGKPIINGAIDKWFDVFMDMRNKFLTTYGV